MSWIREADEEPIPGYRLIRPLGTGGFGEVWLCEAPGKILKAIKFVFGNLDAGASGDGRARQEFHALQRVKEVRHPFVLSTERIDILEGEVAIVMELAEKSLYDVLQERRQEGYPGIARDKLLRYVGDAADGLDYLSETHNLMHLDVKPRNLFLVGDHVKVADFGLAKHLERASSSGIMAGISPQYSAPETFTSRITKHTDQYSLAVVYMELLTGKRPFTGKTIRELALQHMNVEPDLSALSARDRRAVGRALAKDPFKRFPSCKAFIEACIGRPGSAGELSLDASVGPETPPTVPPVPVDEYEAAPKTVKIDLPFAPRTVDVKPSELSSISAALTKPTAPALPFAEVIAEPEPKGLEDSQRVSFELPEAEGGVLRPTLVIGVGGFGLLALRELRSRLTDRVGDLRQVPAFRFLYLDADPDARSVGASGSPDRALLPEQVFPTRLQPVARYRRAALDLLSEWLPREKLHSIPRSMHPQGSRALGRLAFTENYLRFVTRVRRELEIGAHPESLSRSADHSGLPPRDTRPRVFVLAAAGGGSSGALPDIGYAVSKLLTQLKLPAQVTAFLFLGAPADPTTPPEESANTYATLTELNHYADDTITFRSRYGGPDGPQVESPAPPFSTVYLLQRGSRGPTASAECAERLAAFLCLDLTTPLGSELDRTRSASRGLFRAFGTGGVWFPRGLLLRAAARHVCEQLIGQWQSAGPVNSPLVEEMCQKALADAGLKPDRVAAQIVDAVRSADPSADDPVGELLATLEKRFMATEGASVAAWAREAFDAVINRVGIRGSKDPADYAKTGKLSKLYTAASNAVVERWVKQLTSDAFALLEFPGRRVAATEGALARFTEFFEKAEAEAQWRALGITKRAEQAYAQAKAAADACKHGGGFSLFGGKDHRNMRALSTALSQFAACRVAEEAEAGVVRFFRKLRAGLTDKLRDLSICRQRLSHLRRTLEVPETAGASICGGPSPIVELLLPDGGQEIEMAAKKFVETVKPNEIDKLDRALQALVLESRGGLYGACQKAGDFIQELADPLVDQTSAYLSTLLRVNDVAEFAGSDWFNRLTKAHDRAAVTVKGAADQEMCYVLIPDTPAGRKVGTAAARQYQDAGVVCATRSNEVTFCREIRLRPADVREALQYCREPYEELSNRPAPSPHARFDVVEWLPLDV
ncbi:MAG TPA: tubulin-like doman-containing protein [Gemmataceae bacterium]|nr:tubulin-like doman-containing protein [Gemmataceae bacterium]